MYFNDLPSTRDLLTMTAIAVGIVFGLGLGLGWVIWG